LDQNWGWTKDGLAYLKYGALEVSEVYYLTATAFDPADVVVAGDNGTAVGNDTLMGTNQAQIAMQWTVTTPVYLKSVEFWTPAPNLHYTAYLYKGSVTNHDAMPLAVKKINTQETGYYVVTQGYGTFFFRRLNVIVGRRTRVSLPLSGLLMGIV